MRIQAKPSWIINVYFDYCNNATMSGIQNFGMSWFKSFFEAMSGQHTPSKHFPTHISFFAVSIFDSNCISVSKNLKYHQSLSEVQTMNSEMKH